MEFNQLAFQGKCQVQKNKVFLNIRYYTQELNTQTNIFKSVNCDLKQVRAT